MDAANHQIATGADKFTGVIAALAGAAVSYLEVLEQGLRILSLLVGLSIALGMGPVMRRWARNACRYFFPGKPSE